MSLEEYLEDLNNGPTLIESNIKINIDSDSSPKMMALLDEARKLTNTSISTYISVQKNHGIELSMEDLLVSATNKVDLKFLCDDLATTVVTAAYQRLKKEKSISHRTTVKDFSLPVTRDQIETLKDEIGRVIGVKIAGCTFLIKKPNRRFFDGFQIAFLKANPHGSWRLKFTSLVTPEEYNHDPDTKSVTNGDRFIGYTYKVANSETCNFLEMCLKERKKVVDRLSLLVDETTPKTKPNAFVKRMQEQYGEEDYLIHRTSLRDLASHVLCKRSLGETSIPFAKNALSIGPKFVTDGIFRYNGRLLRLDQTLEKGSPSFSNGEFFKGEEDGKWYLRLHFKRSGPKEAENLDNAS